ncbi:MULTISPECIES: c-type cytochrome [Thiorhodovibrio]|uniref:c-type cytochrome n=1 Tax=Thiorhodovibrio TaxID=61593 RepID=UPI002B2627E4|nr:c-type cytochrome [Thiorhodovibrio litoralis]
MERARQTPTAWHKGSRAVVTCGRLGLGLALAGVMTPVLAGQAELDAALAEYEQALAKQADPENGRKVYLTCAVCHRPEGWGTVDGVYPQIAGQLPSVIIKQLADFRAGNRSNPLMYPFSVPRILGGPQQMADVAAYVSQLPMTPHNDVGPGVDLALGEQLFQENCVDCHGERGQGDAQDHIPAIAGQHFNYLIRQFDAIRSGARKNADSEMVKQIEGFTPQQESAVLDYVARLRPPAEKLGRDGWVNPDFPGYVRDAMLGVPPPMPLPLQPPEPPPPPQLPELPPLPPLPEPPFGASGR